MLHNTVFFVEPLSKMLKIKIKNKINKNNNEQPGHIFNIFFHVWINGWRDNNIGTTYVGYVVSLHTYAPKFHYWAFSLPFYNEK